MRRAEALYFSTHGKQPYFRYAARFHADHGFPAAGARLLGGGDARAHGRPAGRSDPGAAGDSHAVPSGRVPAAAARGRHLAVPVRPAGPVAGPPRGRARPPSTPRSGRDDREITVEHHIVREPGPGGSTSGWPPTPRGRRSGPATGSRPPSPPGATSRPTCGGCSTGPCSPPSSPPAAPGATARRSRLTCSGCRPRPGPRQVASLDRTIAYYAGLVRLHLIARAPTRLTAREKEQRADQALVDLRARVDADAPDLVRTTVAAGGFQPGPISEPDPTLRGHPGRPGARHLRQQPAADEEHGCRRDAVRDPRLPDRAEPAVARRVPGLLGPRRGRPAGRADTPTSPPPTCGTSSG